MKIDGQDIKNLQCDLVQNSSFAPGPVTPDSAMTAL
jgi:hypothetical protein